MSLENLTQPEKIRELKKRLEKLNRAPIKKGVEIPPPASRDPMRDLRRHLDRRKAAVRTADPQTSEKPAPLIYRRDMPFVHTRAANEAVSIAEKWKVTLEEAIDGQELVHPQRGPAFGVFTAVRDLEEGRHVDSLFSRAVALGSGHLHERLQADFRGPLLGRKSRRTSAAENEKAMPDSAPTAFSPGDFLFTDIETTGLGGSPLFLIGVMDWQNDGLHVRQYLARDYAEEAAVIAFFIDQCAGRKMLVSFNGKTFDYPYIRLRAAATGVPFSLAPRHFDLLHEGRRLWRGKFADCKLQTLEYHICGRGRTGDIPGHLIPQAYHDFVRTGDAVQIADILTHNMLDLVTLAELMARFPA
jgi:uncharacterized protein YprB with RNaseH-like and TPR domain